LDEVSNVAEYVANNIVTIGCGLEHCHVRVFLWMLYGDIDEVRYPALGGVNRLSRRMRSR
jgi:hypothetical protein